MWMKVTADIKCSRGDCIYYHTSPDDKPCRNCTCNYKSDSMSKQFRYEPTPPPNFTNHENGGIGGTKKG